MKCKIVAIAKHEKENFRKNLVLSSSICEATESIKDLLSYGFNEICISREFSRSHTETEIDIEIFKTKPIPAELSAFQIDAEIVKDAFRRVEHYTLSSKDINELVKDLFLLGAKDIHIRELFLRERKKDCEVARMR